MFNGALFYLACLLYAIYLKAENCVPELLNCFLYTAFYILHNNFIHTLPYLHCVYNSRVAVLSHCSLVVHSVCVLNKTTNALVNPNNLQINGFCFGCKAIRSKA